VYQQGSLIKVIKLPAARAERKSFASRLKIEETSAPPTERAINFARE
jgi:hypothetical protein